MLSVLAANLAAMRPQQTAFESLMAAVANRDTDGKSSEIEALVAAAIRATAANAPGADRLITEAAAVIEIHGANAMALRSIEQELAALIR